MGCLMRATHFEHPGVLGVLDSCAVLPRDGKVPLPIHLVREVVGVFYQLVVGDRILALPRHLLAAKGPPVERQEFSGVKTGGGGRGGEGREGGEGRGEDKRGGEGRGEDKRGGVKTRGEREGRAPWAGEIGQCCERT